MNYHDNIIEKAKRNTFFREVLSTNTKSQLVVMSIPPGGEIGEETHDDIDQILFFIEGNGEALLAGEKKSIEPNHLVIVPAGTLHNFINTGAVDLKLFTIYAPPEHPDGTIHKTKAEADQAHH
jgi:mannose-6-phosphate isomerase-like protein (cupin superfamily)